MWSENGRGGFGGVAAICITITSTIMKGIFRRDMAYEDLRARIKQNVHCYLCTARWPTFDHMR
jgi:hypothetical protein